MRRLVNGDAVIRQNADSQILTENINDRIMKEARDRNYQSSQFQDSIIITIPEKDVDSFIKTLGGRLDF